MKNALSVDVEDWFQVGAFETVIARDAWETPRAASSVTPIMCSASSSRRGREGHLLHAGLGRRAHPALIRRVADAGHEIASHGWDHKRVFTMDEKAFRADLDKAHKAIEDASGTSPTGYRAPSFSIDAHAPGASGAGGSGLSTIAPASPGPPRPLWLERSAALRLASGRGLAADRTAGHHCRSRRPALRGGGRGFFRLLPYRFSSWAIDRVNGNDERPAIFYFHPGRSTRSSRACRTRPRAPRSAITPIST